MTQFEWVIYSRTIVGKIYDGIDESLASWLRRQHVFFTSTAPKSGGHINCSPKGGDSFRILGTHTVAYLDLTGSGTETIAHLRENGRICLMFCAFDGPPRIVRLHGKGEVIQAGDARFESQIEHFMPVDPVEARSARAVILVTADRIADSCGYGVPLLRHEEDRSHMHAWAENRLRRIGPDALAQYQVEKNLTSIDGLPALDSSLPPLDSLVKDSEGGP